MIVIISVVAALCIATIVAVLQVQIVEIDRHYSAKCRKLTQRVDALEALLEPTDIDDDEPQPVAVYGYAPPPPSDTCDTMHVLHGKPFIVSVECEP
jgi:hypothetical protein